MKKISFLLALTFLSVFGFSQNIDEIKDLMSKQQWEKAKTTVDAFLLKEKNTTKWEGWYYKGIIYNEIAKSEQLKNQFPDARMNALNAFKKYYEVDPKAIQATLEQHVRLFEIYSNYFDLAAQNFNAKDYAAAFANFKNALTAEQYIFSKDLEYNNFKFPAFDTVLYQNIALAAFMAKQEDEAAVYYNKIAEQKIGGTGNEDVYQYLVDYYSKKKDLINREKYLHLGNTLYPDSDFWYITEFNDVEDETDKKKIFAKYEELIPKYPNKIILQYNLAVELFNYAYTSDHKPADYVLTQTKLEKVINDALVAKPDYTEATVLMAKHIYNLSFDIQDEQRAIKGTKPEDVKKRADLKAKLMAKNDEMIRFAEKAYEVYNSKTELKAIEKGNFKMIADLLSTAYDLKGNSAKAEEYRKKQESIQ